MSEYVTPAHIFVPKPLLLLAYDQSSGLPENPGRIVMPDPAQHNCQSHLAIETVNAILGLVSEFETRARLFVA